MPTEYNAVLYDGFYYAVMDHTAKTTTEGNGCQTEYIGLPSGWDFVPYSAAVCTNVVWSGSTDAFAWGTTWLLFNQSWGCNTKMNQTLQSEEYVRLYTDGNA